MMIRKFLGSIVLVCSIFSRGMKYTRSHVDWRRHCDDSELYEPARPFHENRKQLFRAICAVFLSRPPHVFTSIKRTTRKIYDEIH